MTKMIFLRNNQTFMSVKKKIIIYITMNDSDQAINSLKERLTKLGCKGNYSLYPFLVTEKDWLKALELGDFDDKKKVYINPPAKLLEKIEKQVIPEILAMEKSSIEDLDIIIAGYSLAGLFSLWCMYETDIFSGAVSCSGSFWYPHFQDFVANNELKSKGSIYLSLGTKEEKSGNQQMRTVGDATRAIFDTLKVSQENEVVLEWNPGNHFTEVEQRVAKGLAWTIAR